MEENETKHTIYGGRAVIITIYATLPPTIHFRKKLGLDALKDNGVNGARVSLFNLGERTIAKIENSTSYKDCAWITLFAELPEDEAEAAAFLGELIVHAGDYWPKPESTPEEKPEECGE